MIYRFYDLDIVSGGDGSSGNPYGAAEFVAQSITHFGRPGGDWGVADAMDISIRGSLTTSYLEFGRAGANNVNVHAWDLALYGPFRIYYSGAFYPAIYCTLSGAIISSDNSIQLRALSASNCVFIAPTFIQDQADLSCKGVIIKADIQAILNQRGGTLTSMYSSVVISPSIICNGEEDNYASFESWNTAFSVPPTTDEWATITLTDCVTDYSLAAIPVWDVPKESWDIATIIPSIPTPPQPGNSPYTGYGTFLWGEARNGIGTGSIFTATAPTWIATYPKSDVIEVTTASFLVETDVNSTAYLVVVPNNASAPSSAQVKAGQDSTGTSVASGFAASVGLTANVEGIFSVSNLVAGTDYDVYFVAQGDLLQAAPVKVDIKTNIIPVWVATYPKTGTIAATTCQLLVEIDQNGTAYFVTVPSGASAPSAVQVKAGQNASSTPVAAGFSGNVALTANVEGNFSTSNLTSGTAYDVYIIAESTALQVSPVSLAITTDIAPSWISTYPKANTVLSQSASFKVSIDEAGTAYFVIVPSGASAPSSAQVKAGQNASGTLVAAGLSGNVGLLTSVEGTLTAANLTPKEGYDVYFVAEDLLLNIQNSPVKVSIYTSVTSMTEIVDINGSKNIRMLSDPTKIDLSIADSTSVQLVTPFDGIGLTDPSLGFNPKVPLTMMALFSDVKIQGRPNGSFLIEVTGDFGGTKCQRHNDNDFSVSWKVRDWDSIESGDAVMTVTPLRPFTSVTFKCTCGVYLNGVNRPDQY